MGVGLLLRLCSSWVWVPRRPLIWHRVNGFVSPLASGETTEKRSPMPLRIPFAKPRPSLLTPHSSSREG